MSENVVVKKAKQGWGTKVWEVIKASKAWRTICDILLGIAAFGVIILLILVCLAIWLIPYLAYIVLPWLLATVAGLVSRSYWLTSTLTIVLPLVAKHLWERYARKWYEGFVSQFDSLLGGDEAY